MDESGDDVNRNAGQEKTHLKESNSHYNKVKILGQADQENSLDDNNGIYIFFLITLKPNVTLFYSFFFYIYKKMKKM